MRTYRRNPVHEQSVTRQRICSTDKFSSCWRSISRFITLSCLLGSLFRITKTWLRYGGDLQSRLYNACCTIVSSDHIQKCRGRNSINRRRFGVNMMGEYVLCYTRHKSRVIHLRLLAYASRYIVVCVVSAGDLHTEHLPASYTILRWQSGTQRMWRSFIFVRISLTGLACIKYSSS